ncbi:MAG: ATP-binding cassette domain-containing protein [Nitrososphaerota archaeon]
MKLKIKYRPSYRFQKLFRVDKEFRVIAPVTRRTVEVARAFGLGIDEEKAFTLFREFEVDINPGDIVYVTGESGGGKTTLLLMLAEEMSKHKEFMPIVTERNIAIRRKELVIHGVGESFQQALEILNYTGLSDAYIYLRRYEELSDGQKYRYKLAKALDKNAKTLVFDEFCATLDRETAKVVAYLIQKICRKMGITLVVATTHEDLIYDANPNILIRKGLGPEVEIEYFKPKPRECSLMKNIVIEQGDMRDLKSLEFWHYKGGFRGWGAKIYRAKLGGKVVGVILYTYPHAYLKARYEAFTHLRELSRKSRKSYLDYVNRCFRRLARIIVHPKYRGIGLSVKLIRETMPLLGVPYVECLAAMARYHPFLEKAGMMRIDTRPSEMIEYIYRRLEEMGFRLDMIQSKKHNLEVLKTLDKPVLKRLKKIMLKTYNPKFKRDAKLLKKVVYGDIEAMAEALKKTPIPTVYYVWKNPVYKEYPDPQNLNSQKN